jgi:hypothetical protein
MNHPDPPNFLFQTRHPWRHRPAEWCPQERKWMHDGRVLRNVKTTNALVWPKDGRRNTTWGQLKDILQNKGPDMYLTINADKHDYMHNRPTRARWAGHTNLDDRGLENSCKFSTRKHAPWAGKRMLGGRKPDLSYDFRTRKYHEEHRQTWTDALWQPEPRTNKWNPYPEAIRNIYGEWFQNYNYVPQELGGPISNRRGKGRFGHYFEAIAQ